MNKFTIFISCIFLAWNTLTVFAQGTLTFTRSTVADLCAQGKALGDINGDGYPDVIIAEGEIAPGAFAWYKYPNWEKYDIHPAAFEAMDYVPDCQAADVDGDGDIDVIVPNSHNSANKSLWWFENPLNDGGDPETDGFAWHVVWSAEDVHIKDVDKADFDRDGRLDIAIRQETQVSIFFQNSDDDWVRHTETIPQHEGFAAGDVNHDGYPDAVVNGQWLKNPGNRTGSWTLKSIDAKWHQQTGGWQINSCRVQVADIDGDGRKDPVFSHSELPGYPVSWYSADDRENGPWTEHVIGYVDYCHTLQTGDVDADGDIDVVGGTMLAASTDEVVLFENLGGGSSWTRHTVAGLSTYIAKMADMGADGDLDVVGSRNWGTSPIDFFENQLDPILPLDRWQYIQADGSRSVQSFGLSARDVTGDGFLDVASGPYFYRNPGGDMTGAWTRVGLPGAVDAVLFADVDGDVYGDIIAQKTVDGALKFYWLEAGNAQGSSFSQVCEVGSVPQASHTLGSQGHRLVQIEAGGRHEVVVTAGNGIYYFRIPASPAAGSWPVIHVNGNPTDEGFGAADIDGDADLDLACGTGETKRVEWYRNPGDGTGSWTAFHIGDMSDAEWTDRFGVADLNGDGRPDIVGTEENGLSSGAETWWWEQPANPASTGWTRRLIASQATTNSLDLADMDRNGHMDVVIAEHRGTEKLAVWSNNGSGTFTEHAVDSGKESHLGALTADLDGDGDRDILSIAWDDYAYLRLWRNDAIQSGAQTVATPVISPNGGTHSGSVQVSLSTSTSGAAIYYTTGGLDPDETSTEYAGAFSVSASLTVKARAYRDGMTASAIASADFVIEEDNTPPQISTVSASGNPNRAQVTFNEDMDETTAETSGYYEIDQSMTVSSASLSTDNRSVLLETSTLSPGVTYTLTVNHVEDLNGNPVAANTQRTFQYVSVQLADGLVAYYDLDEKTGATVHDRSGNGHDGTLSGGQWNTGRIDGAADFDGSDDYVNLGGLDVSGGAMTIACWFRADDFENEDGRLVSKATGIQEADHYWMLSTTTGGGQARLRFRLKTNGSTSTLVAGSGNLAAGAWTHAAAVYNGTSMTIYKDGVSVGAAGKTGTLSANAGVSAWMGGNPPTAGSNAFDGRIDEVRIYNRALSQEEIAALSSSPVRASISVFLEGPYLASSDRMSSALNGVFLPAVSPHIEDPRVLGAMPGGITDWVLVQLRTAAGGQAVLSKSALLRTDGRITADDGTLASVDLNVPAGNYYILVKHRNHLAAMSKTAQALDAAGPGLYDFTAGTDKYYDDDARFLEAGVYGLYAGDTDGSGTIDASDRSAAWNGRNASGYLDADCDLSGTMDASDRSITWNNRNKSTSIP